MYQEKVFNCVCIVKNTEQGYRWINFMLEDNVYIKWYRAQMELTDEGDILIRAVFGFKRGTHPDTVKKWFSTDSLEITENVEDMIKECTSEERRIVGSTLKQKGNYQPTQWDKDLAYACGLGNVQASMDHMEKNHKLRYISAFKKLRKHFIMLQPCTIQYTLDQFTEPRIPQEELATKTIVLIGTTWLGKTKYAKAHFKNPAVIRSGGDYFKINPTTDGIIFDDMEICKWTPSYLKTIVDLKVTGRQKIKYGLIYLPEGVPRIIINLCERHFWPKSLFGQDGMVSLDAINDYEAIKENIIIKNIDKPLYNISKEEIEEDINKNPTTWGTAANPSRRAMKRKRRTVQRRLKKLKTDNLNDK